MNYVDPESACRAGSPFLTTKTSTKSPRRAVSILSALVSFLAFHSATAQYTQEFSSIPVIIAGDTSAVPFFGGLNSPKPSLHDFDGDGLVDLFIGESTGKLNYLHNDGTPQVPLWQVVTDRFGGLNIGMWHVLVDIDGDGDLDLFCDNLNNGAKYYRNESIGASVSFVEVDSAYGGFATGINNTPAFADIDGDHDYDFFIGDTNGRLVFYRNDGDSANPSFSLVSTAYDSILAFPGGGVKKIAEPNHGFSAIFWADIDADSDIDLFWGDLFNANLYYFENLGSSDSSALTYNSETYLPIETFGHNHTPLADIDGDGDFDIVLGAANGQNIDNLRLLRNVGTPEVASFVQESTNLIDNLDFGRSSFPALADIDGDGDYDLFVGAGDGQIRFLENIGDRNNPVFQLVTDLFAGIDVGLTAIPTFVDWDADGDLDLLVGTELGKIEYWRNDGDACTFVGTRVTDQLAGIKVDQLAVPVPVDLNGDGLLDLVVGEWDFNGKADILLYENVGSSGSPSLSLVTTKLIRIGQRDFTIPVANDWDGDGDYDLLVGMRDPEVIWYRNDAGPHAFPDSLSLMAQTDTIPGGDVGLRPSLSFVDIDSDGDLDIFAGEEYGGVNFLRHDGGTPYSAGDADGSGSISIGDAVFLINYIFGGGLPPMPLGSGDADCSGGISIGDAVFLINYIFGGGPAPCGSCSV